MSRQSRELSTLKDMAFVQLSIAQLMLRKIGHVSPFTVVQLADGSVSYFDLPDDKSLWKLFLILLLSWKGAQRYFVVSEAWTCTLSKEGPSGFHRKIVGLPVTDNPLRYEALLVAAIERTGKCVVIEQQFAHDPKGIKLFKPVYLNGATRTMFPTYWIDLKAHRGKEVSQRR
jgi:hypothetical protein